MTPRTHEKGIALFIAVIAISALLLISFSIADIAYKQQVISFAGRESKGAFYAADTGLECVLFHDLKVADFFSTNSPAGGVTGTLSCDNQSFSGTVDPTTTSGIFSTTTSHVSADLNAKNCFKVDVAKVTNSSKGDIVTFVTSRGYNTTCANLASQGLRNVERALEVRY